MSVFRFLFGAILLSTSLTLPAAEIDWHKYRDAVDNARNYDFNQRDEIIGQLDAITTDSIDKPYLLGMLYFIQAVDAVRIVSQNTEPRPTPEQVLATPEVIQYFDLAEQSYDQVEAKTPGYRYLYCRYADLYRYRLDKHGFNKVVRLLKDASPSDENRQCRKFVEDVAAHFFTEGMLDMAQAIYRSTIKHWGDRPTYMLERMGDIENQLGEEAIAKEWWQQCQMETDDEALKKRCTLKILSTQL